MSVFHRTSVLPKAFLKPVVKLAPAAFSLSIVNARTMMLYMNRSTARVMPSAAP